MKITRDYLKRVIKEELEQEVNKGFVAGAALTALTALPLAGAVSAYNSFKQKLAPAVQQLQNNRFDLFKAYEVLKQQYGVEVDTSQISTRGERGSGRNNEAYEEFLSLLMAKNIDIEEFMQKMGH